MASNSVTVREAGDVRTDVADRAGARSVAQRRPLRVCHLAYTFYENDNRVIRYAEAASERGDAVDVIALRRPGQSWTADVRGVRLHRIQHRAVTEKGAGTYLAKILLFFMKASAVLSYLQLRGRYDVVHVHNVPDFLIFAAFLPKLMGARLLLDIHDILPELYAGKFGTASNSPLFRALLLVERLSCSMADHVILSNHLWEVKVATRSVARHKCSTFLNYPDLRLFRPLSRESTKTDQAFLILYPGTLNEHQGLDVAVEAFALVKDRMPLAQFHIYGEGPARSGLVQLVAQLGLSGRVKILDRLPIEQISRVMAAADLGVVPKRAEGFGNEAFSTKILEFMACGVPVLVSRTQVDSYYFDETLVRFFGSGNRQELAEALLDAYRGRGEDSDAVRRAREFAVRYSWQERIGDYRMLIDTLAGCAVHV
jgi:glycosyltransferase involved in cell wall biosynthesis